MPLTAASNSNASGGILSGSGTSYFMVGSAVTVALGAGVVYMMWSRKRGGSGGDGIRSGALKDVRRAGDGRGKLGLSSPLSRAPPPPPGKPPKHAFMSYDKWVSLGGKGEGGEGFSVNPLYAKRKLR